MHGVFLLKLFPSCLEIKLMCVSTHTIFNSCSSQCFKLEDMIGKWYDSKTVRSSTYNILLLYLVLSTRHSVTMNVSQLANKCNTRTHPHTHITSLITWSFSLFPRESLTWVRASVHPVLPTFIRPLTQSRHVHSSPRMWKPILACHLLTVTHIINRKSSCWLPKALNTSGEPLSARQTFFTNEAKTFVMTAYLDGCCGAFS